MSSARNGVSARHCQAIGYTAVSGVQRGGQLQITSEKSNFFSNANCWD
jgi:predicted methyltransferase